ncbi:hypothetical protein TIFTF001_055079, partial [Ficus carica]
MNGVKIKSWQ